MTPVIDNSEANVEGSSQIVPAYEEAFIETHFDEGPLGVTLRRRPEDGIVFIYEIVQGSQAVNMDVMALDELWSVGDSEIGETPLDKDAWNGLINYIKTSPRPIRLVWHRKPKQLDNSPIVKSKSPEYQDLERLLSRLIIKDKDPKISVMTKKIDPMSLLIEGRKILRSGELSISVKNSVMWSRTFEARRIILMTDLLLVSIPQPGNVYALEYVIELPTCKLRSLGQTFGGGDAMNNPTAPNDNNVADADLQFDLISPVGELMFMADSKEIKEVWVLNIYLAICETVGDKERVLGWRHQYMLGTMHSAVLCRDEARVRQLISFCESGRAEFLSIEAADEDGYTPLHYACMLRLHGIIKMLHEATADVTAADPQGLTPLHWSALQLDDYALSLLCDHVFDLDVLDSRNRSPLSLCCLEGRDRQGLTDGEALRRCLQHMIPHKPTLHWFDEQGRTLIHHLAASWQFEALEELLEADVSDVNSIEVAQGMVPLHFAVQARPTKKNIGESQRIMNPGVEFTTQQLLEPEPLHRPHGVDTIRALLKAGAKPNYQDCQGRTPLSMLVMDSEAQQRWQDREEILPPLAMLISFGARADDPAVAAALKNKFSELAVPAFVEKWASLAAIDCNALNVKGNHFEILTDLDSPAQTNDSIDGGGVSSPRSQLQTQASVGLAIGKKGGCTLCCVQFTLFRRQHHCRLCNALCCDECSKKRAVLDATQVSLPILLLFLIV